MGDFILGLDLGQSADFTALAILERIRPELPPADPVPFFLRDLIPPAAPQPSEYHCRHLQRFELQTPYPRIVDQVVAMMGSPELVEAELVIDATGVGRAVVDMFVDAGLRFTAVTITAGSTAQRDGLNWRVPKRDLVGSVVSPLQQGKLKFAAGMPLVPTLIQEMLNFKVQISESGHDSYSAWRKSAHDDLVLALALACWWGAWQERHTLTLAEQAAFSKLFQWW